MKWLAFWAVCLGLAGAAHAQEALYGKQPPPGSAFIRFMNATADDVTVSSDFDRDVHLGTAPDGRVSPYSVVEKAAARDLTLTAMVGTAASKLATRAPADGYVTVVVSRDAAGALTLSPILDQAAFNQNRVRLAFYNLAPGCAAATLALEPSGPAVFQGVPQGATKSRAVNPVEAHVRASCGDQPGASLALSGMALGASYSIWLMEPGGSATLLLTPDATARYKPAG